ncbi:hypothetical protein O181_105058 [Austropuccinia psidii MF-1]|uniref:Uncharacterized protein n=1 Tax=Austropuccinia psidii MF-1 TaxID=1389203 RepID=A0A9Q3JLD3_9BASI|nr:hypothetical protein [Austropuccinia psidii MF-1]
MTIGPSSNVLSPSPSFMGRISTFLRSRSEVTIGWWPRRGVDKSILEGTGLILRNRSCQPVWGPGFHLCSDMVSSSSTKKESLRGRLGGNSSGCVVGRGGQQTNISCVLVGKHHKCRLLSRNKCRG